MAVTWNPDCGIPHEGSIVKAFDHFWAQLWTKLAQTQAVTDTSRRPTAPLNSNLAPNRTTKPLTAMKRGGRGKRTSQLTKSRPTISHRQSGPWHVRRSPTYSPQHLRPNQPLRRKSAQQGQWCALGRAGRPAQAADHSWYCAAATQETAKTWSACDYSLTYAKSLPTSYIR
ncbi:Hypothetical predicted protein [Pelobates cultripes]|uniref:Uncharacterized protein n=1 Tax=Pelobates cultripes TaxID=61616 RepID=A0AAD1WET8_PELCU|nr:Hypothetical predicted protein [Pelobates cultripes]